MSGKDGKMLAKEVARKVEKKEDGGKEKNDNDRKPQNTNFVQFNKPYMKQWRELARKNPVSVEIMFFLVERMGRDNAVICSRRVLEEITGTSSATVGRALKVLRDGKWLQKIRVGSAQAFVLNSRVVWQTTATRKQYAIFSATVVAAGSENEEEVKAFDEPEIKQSRLMPVPAIFDGERPTITDERLPPPDQDEMDLI